MDRNPSHLVKIYSDQLMIFLYNFISRAAKGIDWFLFSSILSEGGV